MHTTVTYLFDPLCGWCYGASPVIQQLGRQGGIQLALAPTGLFSGPGARAMDASFADYAWSNDQRIEKLTGQRFTGEYRAQVLNQPGARFDSGAATLALTAVSLTEPRRELDALKALQEARYLRGLNTSSAPVVAGLLRELGLAGAAGRLLAGDSELLLVNDARVQRAQRLLHSHGAQGVPALVVSTGGASRLLRGDALYAGLEKLLADLAQG
jgi:putative protein-disulfide isomerase